jgi:predicted aldo/keto reductase-like oxidoreductase
MLRIRFGGVLVAWVLALAVAGLAGGAWIAQLAEGVLSSPLMRFAPIATLAAILAALAVTWIWAWRRRDPAPGATADQPGRRRFLAGSALTLSGLGGSLAAIMARNLGWLDVMEDIVRPQVPHTHPNPSSAWRDARVRAYRRLGRTGFEVSDISLGSGRITEADGGEDIAREAIERGVNYFDTAPDYSGASSERALGKALRGRREQMFVATKFCTPEGHLPAGSSVAEYVRVVEDSLHRLQTDYVDLVHVHACNQLERLLDPRMHEAFERLREQGKARFLGFSSHTPNLELIANRAIDDGRFDLMMLAYHHGRWPNLGPIIERAHAADVGVVAMKTLKGARHRGLKDFRDEADAYSQAAFKWVLSNPHVSCLVISIFKQQHLDEYLHASGHSLRPADVAVLERYDELIAGLHCFAHCGACLDACPEGVPIADVLRHRMYFEDYGTQKIAMQEYARLGQPADVCAGCSAPCARACPHGIPIPERTRGAHELLTLG